MIRRINVVAFLASGLILLAALHFSQSRSEPPTPVDTGLSLAFAERADERWITMSGEVARILADDNDGSRHQRFIVRSDEGVTVLIAHNIDLGERVPLSVGDLVSIRGKYVWNDKGGIVHWTHRDPRGRESGGWIRHEGRTYASASSSVGETPSGHPRHA